MFLGFLKIGITDIIEILLIGLLLYRVYKLMRGTIAIKVVLGLLTIYFFYLVVKNSNMLLLTSILDSFMNMGLLAAIIVFQQEIRRFLFIIGGTSFKGYFAKKLGWLSGKNNEIDINPLVDAIKSLSGTNTGALLVISKFEDLKVYEESGDKIDAQVSKRLLLSIFNKHSPLHDGGAIISNNRILAARCVLPVTENENIPAQFGLRHRAAIGVSEVSSSLVIIVSEETGQIAITKKGILKSNLSLKEVRSELKKYYNIDQDILNT